MTEYKTLRVPEESYHAAKDAKHDDETWGEFLQRCSETRPEIREFVDASELDDSGDGVPDALSYEDVVSASEKGARNALEDLQ